MLGTHADTSRHSFPSITSKQNLKHVNSYKEYVLEILYNSTWKNEE